MKEETKNLLTIKGKLSSILRVSQYLEKEAEKDAELEQAILNSGKDVNDCWSYITFKAKGQAKGDNTVMVADDEVFGWAKYYYLENEKAQAEMKPKTTKVEKPKATESADAKTSTKTKKSKKEKEPVVIGEKDLFAVEYDDQDLSKEDEAQVTEVEPEKNVPNESEVVEAIEEQPVEPEKPLDLLDYKCVICGKPMRIAFAGKPEEDIRRWASFFISEYNCVFCSKEHKVAYTSRNSEEH